MKIICFGALLFALIANMALAQTLYRWTDAEGKVHYTDQPPPKDAKTVQEKKLGGNVIDTADLPYATREAAKKYPVTLWLFDCGQTCDQARALLRKRGIPATEVDLSADPANPEKLKALTGGLEVPVLQIGESTLLKGFNEVRWGAALSNAGYAVPSTLRSSPPAAGKTKAPAPSSTPESAPAPPVSAQ